MKDCDQMSIWFNVEWVQVHVPSPRRYNGQIYIEGLVQDYSNSSALAVLHQAINMGMSWKKIST